MSTRMVTRNMTSGLRPTTRNLLLSGNSQMNDKKYKIFVKRLTKLLKLYYNAGREFN